MEQRAFKINLIKKISKKFLYILLIVSIYNAFLITKSALDNTASKEIFGYKAYIITTDSMKPAIREGDAVIVEKVEEEKLKVGDIVTIRNAKEVTITHRIVAITTNKETGEKEYATKGDNNKIEDPEVTGYENIEGKKVLVIPLFGKILLSLRSKTYIVIFAMVIGLIILRVVNRQKKSEIRREKKKYEDNKTKKEQQNIVDSSKKTTDADTDSDSSI